uniref:G-protein coupled receptors family 1 profile domain-containing protein n=1 Tax=Cyclopterus lumpus TaxID=8103 RepID=A0A8C2X8P5_CYCLU
EVGLVLISPSFPCRGMNSRYPSSIAYEHVGNLKYLYFMLTAMLYIVIVIVNISLIVVICMNRSLHEPMYLFLCSLFVNELYGSSGLFPFLLVQILSDIHNVSCRELLNLAVMSYDRFLAICYPLQYNTLMTFNKAVVFIAVIWFYSFVKFLITLSLNIRLTFLNNIYGLFGIILTILVPLLPILFSYMRILKICFCGSKQTRQRAVSTCTPHLASLLNFSFGCFFEIIQSRFDMTNVPRLLRIILSLYFLIIQPLLNPIMFGLQMSKIRNTCKRILCYKMFTCRKDTM